MGRRGRRKAVTRDPDSGESQTKGLTDKGVDRQIRMAFKSSTEGHPLLINPPGSLLIHFESSTIPSEGIQLRDVRPDEPGGEGRERP